MLVCCRRPSAGLRMHNRCCASAYQLLCKRTTAVVRPTELTSPITYTIFSDNFICLFRQLLPYSAIVSYACVHLLKLFMCRKNLLGMSVFQSSRRKTKQFSSYFRFPTSHTTVRAVPHTAVPILDTIRDTHPLKQHTLPYIDAHLL